LRIQFDQVLFASGNFFLNMVIVAIILYNQLNIIEGRLRINRFVQSTRQKVVVADRYSESLSVTDVIKRVNRHRGCGELFRHRLLRKN